MKTIKELSRETSPATIPNDSGLELVQSSKNISPEFFLKRQPLGLRLDVCHDFDLSR